MIRRLLARFVDPDLLNSPELFCLVGSKLAINFLVWIRVRFRTQRTRTRFQLLGHSECWIHIQIWNRIRNDLSGRDPDPE